MWAAPQCADSGEPLIHYKTVLDSFDIDTDAGFISPGNTTTKMREIQFGLKIVF
jgi:hypothetical protein